MSTFRIALANLQFPVTPEESITLAVQALAAASVERADLICFPECFVPGYRGMGKVVPPADPVFLERAWTVIAAAAAKADVAVVLGTERVIDGALRITALVIDRDGTMAGFQDKVQLDPSEESVYSPGSERRVFRAGPLKFVSQFAMKVGAIQRLSAGPFGAARMSCFTLISTRLSRAATGPRVSPILRTRFMRKQPCAAPPKTPAISQP